MTHFVRVLIASFLFSAAALGQLPPNVIQHVIVVIQENRTPDNLFGGDIAGLPNANLATSGACHANQITLYPWPLDACFDPHHSHYPAWSEMWDRGHYDGACDVQSVNATCVSPGITPNYTYAEDTLYDGVHGVLDPYYQIASTYGFANYMFQTNQGPSFEAHQFLFSGTSAPDDYDDPAGQECYYSDTEYYPCWEWFAAELPQGTEFVGCTDTTTYVPDIDPHGHEAYGYQGGYPCYNHNSLATLLDAANIPWRYYTPKPYGYWTAPNAIMSTCAPSGGQCTANDWQQDVILANSGNYVGDYAPVLTDIGNCALQPVSWVVPDGVWSDHPGGSNPNAPNDGGPSWVAAIINAVGNATSCDNNAGYWSDTVILVTWDDWGGWFDHVSPAKSAGGPGDGFPNGTGTSYVYGARVPLLVVSGYAKQGYVSGPQSSPNCSAGGVYYCHDFGSILGFTEYVFGLGQISSAGATYPYADYLAPDSPTGLCGSATACPYPLADFFTSTFTPFITQIGATKYPPKCFHVPNQKGCWPGFIPQNPDNDGDEDRD